MDFLLSLIASFKFNIQKTVLFIIVLFSFSTAFALNYYRCEKDEDCARAYGGCGRYLSVHKRYKELYEAKARKSDTTAFCLPPSEVDKARNQNGKVQCLKQECRLLLPKE